MRNTVDDYPLISDQVDWGTGKTELMTEERKQEVREQGLDGESSR